MWSIIIHISSPACFESISLDDRNPPVLFSSRTFRWVLSAQARSSPTGQGTQTFSAALYLSLQSISNSNCKPLQLVHM